MAAAGVAAQNRLKVIFWGIAAAVIMRIGFAVAATRLLEIIGLTLAGGILLLTRFHWIAYLGLAVITYVAVEMIWRGGLEVLAATGNLGLPG
jgi:predicted tellurium resistance membrane protein TerC